MNTVRCGFDGIPTVWFGAVLRNRESYGAVRCGLQILEVLRCGSVRFSDVVNPTVRFVNRTEPHRTDRKNRTVKTVSYTHLTLPTIYSV